MFFRNKCAESELQPKQTNVKPQQPPTVAKKIQEKPLTDCDKLEIANEEIIKRLLYFQRN